MEIKRTDTGDIDKPYWRMSIQYENHRDCIEIEKENFESGFNRGEDWNQIFEYEEYYLVSFMTKLPNGSKIVDENFNKLLDAFYKLLKRVKKSTKTELAQEIRREKEKIEGLKDAINSKIFRTRKIDKLLKT